MLHGSWRWGNWIWQGRAPLVIVTWRASVYTTVLVSFCSRSVLHCALHFTTEGVGKHCEGLRPVTSLQLSFQQSRTRTCGTAVLSCELVWPAVGASWKEQVKLSLYMLLFFCFLVRPTKGAGGFFQSVERWCSAAAFEGPSWNSLSETSPVHQMISVSVVCRWSDTTRQTRMPCPPSDWRHASLPVGRMSSWPNPWYGLLVTYHPLFTCCVRSDPVETEKSSSWPMKCSAYWSNSKHWFTTSFNHCRI